MTGFVVFLKVYIYISACRKSQQKSVGSIIAIFLYHFYQVFFFFFMKFEWEQILGLQASPKHLPYFNNAIVWIVTILSILKFLFLVDCSPMLRESRVQSQVESYQRLKKVALNASLLNTQHYMVRIKGKVDQSKEWSCAFPSRFSSF